MSILHFSRWKTIAILATVMIGVLLALPNAVPADSRKNFPAFMSDTINLGLDLQGGAHMLLEVDTDSVEKNELRKQETNIKDALRAAKIRPQRVDESKGIVTTILRDENDMANALVALEELETRIDSNSLGGAKTVKISQIDSKQISLVITPENIEAIKDQTIKQSIEVLRRRIDPQGTTEMTLAKEGSDRILLQIPGAKNVDDIKARINDTANLSFHLVDPATFDRQKLIIAAERGITPSGTVFYPNEDGSGMIVDKSTRITGECLTKAEAGIHPQNNVGAVINFWFNGRCAREFGKLTSENVGRQFAVVLNDVIVTAPNIRSPITGGRGYIEGSFGMDEARETSLLLTAGALPAKLNIVEERTVGAELGADAIRAGKIASIIGLMGVGIFMWLSYGFRFGTIANIALGTNILLIAGALSFLGSTLTLPGIAGIILTIGMAVDANVLIFERIREEAHNGRPPVNAIETGYRRSFAPILDANITTLIAAVTLYFVGSGPVRGFAVTLAIGIVMSVFTAVVFARLITATWLRGTRPKTLPI
ncbi:MAG: protein translocase subunit SecD [Hellea sp.]|nr:protein translocase subunit SecD [Hellea sp.]